LPGMSAKDSYGASHDDQRPQSQFLFGVLADVFHCPTALIGA